MKVCENCFYDFITRVSHYAKHLIDEGAKYTHKRTMSVKRINQAIIENMEETELGLVTYIETTHGDYIFAHEEFGIGCHFESADETKLLSFDSPVMFYNEQLNILFTKCQEIGNFEEFNKVYKEMGYKTAA